MRAIWIPAAMMAAGMVGAPPATAQTDVLAPARSGQLQCYEPNLAQRTCRALAGYTIRNDGRFDNTAQVMVSSDPVIVMTAVSTVVVRNGAVCGPLTREHLAGAQFTIEGQPAVPEDAAVLREQLAQIPGFLAEEFCTTYTPNGNELRAQFTINGAPRANESARVIWVRPDEGYRVAP